NLLGAASGTDLSLNPAPAQGGASATFGLAPPSAGPADAAGTSPTATPAPPPHGQIQPFQPDATLASSLDSSAAPSSRDPIASVGSGGSGGSGGCGLPPVVDAGPDVNGPEGQPLGLQASFSDPDGMGPYSVSITWGDGSGSQFSYPSPGS